MQTILVAKD